MACVVECVRTEERSLEFQSGLARDRRDVSASAGYSLDNFAYGSTPVASWEAVFAATTHATTGNTHLSRVMREAAAACSCTARETVGGRRRGSVGPRVGGDTYVVLGSSLGQLALAGYLLHGWRTVGVEILPHLARFSAGLAAKFGGPRDEVAVVEGDMLEFDGLERAALVLLTSQCWDKVLLDRTYDTLSTRLPLGAVVVDYLPHLTPSTSGGAAAAAAVFERVAEVVVPVSWNPRHTFVISRKVREPSR